MKIPAAFPTPDECYDIKGNITSGMSLRDYFAGQIISGMLANPEIDLSRGSSLGFMRDIFSSADDMLKVSREKAGGG